MAEDTQELEIKIIPDEEANAEAAQAADEKAAAKKAEVEQKPEPQKDPAVEELASQFREAKAAEEAANRRAAESDRRAAAAEQQAETAKKQVANSQLDTVVTALNAAKADAEAAKRDIRAAKEAQDVEAEIEAQDRLAMARADERRLDEAKADLEARAKAPPKREQPQQVDAAEAYVRNRTPQTEQWLRAHMDFVRDPRKQAKLSAAHYDAEGEGLVADTPEYFAHVEKFLGITKSGEVEKKPPTEAAQVRPKPAPVAPGSAVANGGSSGGQTVVLTQREANAAIDGTIVWNWDDPKGKFKKGDPIGHAEMGRRKLAMQKQGLYDKTAYEA